LLPSLAPWRSRLECTDWLLLERRWIWVIDGFP